MVAIILDTVAVLEGLRPSERRALGDFGWLQAVIGSRPRDEGRLLRAVAEACEALAPYASVDECITQRYELVERLDRATSSHRQAVWYTTTNWLRSGSPNELRMLVLLLMPPP